MKMVEISKLYEDNLLARVLVNAIPYIGGSLDATLTSKWSGYWKQRIEELLIETEKELASINERMIDKDFIESEEFYDIVSKIANDVTSSRCREKRVGYAKIIKSALLKEDTIANLEDIVAQITNMREKDLIYLKIIKDLFDKGKQVTGFSLSKVMKSYSYSPIECELHLYRMENLGLLDHPRNTLTGRGYVAFQKTSLFDKIVGYLGL